VFKPHQEPILLSLKVHKPDVHLYFIGTLLYVLYKCTLHVLYFLFYTNVLYMYFSRYIAGMVVTLGFSQNSRIHEFVGTKLLYITLARVWRIPFSKIFQKWVISRSSFQRKFFS
jgi:hypothetical protein